MARILYLSVGYGRWLYFKGVLRHRISADQIYTQRLPKYLRQARTKDDQCKKMAKADPYRWLQARMHPDPVRQAQRWARWFRKRRDNEDWAYEASPRSWFLDSSNRPKLNSNPSSYDQCRWCLPHRLQSIATNLLRHIPAQASRHRGCWFTRSS